MSENNIVDINNENTLIVLNDIPSRMGFAISTDSNCLKSKNKMRTMN